MNDPKLVAIRMLNVIRASFLFFCLASASLTATADDDRELPTRANDLLYGQALYEYFQGRSFESLSLLNVAKEKGGVKGHGDHPLLIEGGLMLAYGMTRAAHQHFSYILSDELRDSLSPEVRNQAWFYLGKVFYLEKDYMASREALEKVDPSILSVADQEIAFEWRYLLNQIQLNTQGVIELGDESIETSLAEGDLWIVYTLYNMAIATSSKSQSTNESALEGSPDGVLIGLNKAQNALNQFMLVHGSTPERAALLDRIRLSMAQELIRAKQYQSAVQELSQIPFDSFVSDEALFYFAIAQSHLKEHKLAISALNRLKDKPLFTPWLKQVPYALAYLYEQLGDVAISIQAYKAAGDHYDAMIRDLDAQEKNLSEATLLKAMEVPFARSDSVSEPQYIESGMPIRLGDDSAVNDAYGRLNVRPAEFYLANLLSTESFQLHLRDLHELYKLQNALDIWESRVGSFRIMLATREIQRNERLESVSSALDAQNAAQWSLEYQSYKENIESALENEDVAFFMNEEQIDIAARLQQARRNLALLPEGEEKQEYNEKFSRIERFFKWQLADQYGVNRWVAQRQLRRLSNAMDEFEMRREFLQGELENLAFQDDLKRRVENTEFRIIELSRGIDEALIAARDELIALARAELNRQRQVVVQYQLSSRHAQARLTDELYRVGQETNREAEPAESSETPAEQESFSAEVE